MPCARRNPFCAPPGGELGCMGRTQAPDPIQARSTAGIVAEVRLVPDAVQGQVRPPGVRVVLAPALAGHVDGAFCARLGSHRTTRPARMSAKLSSVSSIRPAPQVCPSPQRSSTEGGAETPALVGGSSSALPMPFVFAGRVMPSPLLTPSTRPDADRGQATTTLPFMGVVSQRAEL